MLSQVPFPVKTATRTFDYLLCILHIVVPPVLVNFFEVQAHLRFTIVES